MTSVTKNLHPQPKIFFSSAIYETGRSIRAIEQLSGEIGARSWALLKQPKTAVF